MTRMLEGTECKGNQICGKLTFTQTQDKPCVWVKCVLTKFQFHSIRLPIRMTSLISQG